MIKISSVVNTGCGSVQNVEGCKLKREREREGTWDSAMWIYFIYGKHPLKCQNINMFVGI